VEWVVVDDCEQQTPLRMGQVSVRPTPYWSGEHTLIRNLFVGVNASKGDKLLFLEDDEVYLPGYVATMVQLLQDHALVGEIPARYYNMPTRSYRVLQNNKHASLCQTAVRRDLFPFLAEVLDACDSGQPFVDLLLWRRGGRLVQTENVVSLKGLPGRTGIGMGHRTMPARFTPDHEMKQLVAWIGEERAMQYAALLR
jgi:hypothetical protein